MNSQCCLNAFHTVRKSLLVQSIIGVLLAENKKLQDFAARQHQRITKEAVKMVLVYLQHVRVFVDLLFANEANAQL